VAGYDYTFSVPKSVSVLWGLADAGSQELLVKAHHDAMADVLAFMEREVAVTRVGRNGAAQAEVTGVLATAYDHWDSRAGDPQLHTHVVVSNKVCTAKDGKWRTLDGRPMHAATVAMSELYDGVLADHLTRLFGLGWDTRDRGRNRNPAWEVEGVTEELIAEFYRRTAAIEAEKDRLVAVDTPHPRSILRGGNSESRRSGDGHWGTARYRQGDIDVCFAKFGCPGGHISARKSGWSSHTRCREHSP
jgi:conjugative relaxase-like TrwC/TraI family protein